MTYREIREGLLATDVSGAFGGIVHRMKNHVSKGTTSEMTIVTRDVQPELTQAMKALVNRADYLCRSTCAWTQVGWIVLAERAPTLQDKFALLADEAKQLNRAAQKKGSARRVRLGVVLSRFVEPEQQFEAVDLAVRDGLATLAGLLRDGNVQDGKVRSPWRPTYLKMANLETLLRGKRLLQYESALRQAIDGRRLFLDLIAKPSTVEKAARAMNRCAKQIEDAVAWFVDEGVV